MMTESTAMMTSSVPAKKRKIPDDSEANDGSAKEVAAKMTKRDDSAKAAKRQGMSKAREIRLEQNRKSARESRMRKKKMLEDLQRSLVFFTKANAALRTEHEMLTRNLTNTHSKLNELGLAIPEPMKTEETQTAAKPTVVSIPVVSSVMEPGATMQAMATFQQAAAVAMQSTAQVMQTSGLILDTVASS